MGREQAEIAKSQAKIVETQHQIMLDQMSKRAILELAEGRIGGPLRDKRHLIVRNRGTKPVNGIRWELLIPIDLIHCIEFVDPAVIKGCLASYAKW